MNRKQILIGLMPLFVGLMVYLVDRPPDQTYFVYKVGSALSVHNVIPPLFGPLGEVLPAFVHVFSFTLLTAGILACQRRGCIVACLGWLSVDVAFELGQKFGVWSSNLVPSWFEGIPLLENTVDYLMLGSFDLMDLTAIAAGSLVAYLTLMRTLERRV
jgi:hypothetical protein